ncbi:MAG: SUMF1/EgtB/PvdO family nonheme iron enzyme [Bacteroidia bacterium]
MTPDTDTKRGFEYPGKHGETSVTPRRNHLLVIGIDRYAHFQKLNNPVSDSKGLVEVLTERYRFEPGDVRTLFDKEATREGIIDALDELTAKVTPADNLLIYFAGHGYYRKVMKIGYLIPVDARKEKFSDLISNTTIRDYISAIQAHHTLLIVDSCFSGSLLHRDAEVLKIKALADKVDRLPSRWGLAAGLVELVSDGPIGGSSPFAQSLLTYLRENNSPRFPVSELVQYVSKITTYNADQTPVGGVLDKTSHLGGQFVFDLRESVLNEEETFWRDTLAKNTMVGYRDYRKKFPEGTYRSEALSQIRLLEETESWEKALARNKVSSFEDFLEEYPGSPYAPEAQKRIDELLNPVAVTQSVVKTAIPTKVNFPTPEMVLIKGGTFNREKYKVTVSDFWLSKTAVTVGEYLRFCEATNTHWPEWLEKGSNYHFETGKDDHYKKRGYNKRKGIENLPVAGVSWHNAVAYCDWLSEHTGEKWRLPTEAEWEYAAGGGSKERTIYAGTNDEKNLGKYAWYSGNSNSQPHPVGQKKPNQLGLYDMSGNVWEWCGDWYGDYPSSDISDPQGHEKGWYRVLRGGSWLNSSEYCRVAFRGSNAPEFRFDYFGFRVACQF